MTVGVMQILQMDNGREFKGALLLLMKQHNVQIKYGRPCTPQTQGLVEQANGTGETAYKSMKKVHKNGQRH